MPLARVSTRDRVACGSRRTSRARRLSIPPPRACRCCDVPSVRKRWDARGRVSSLGGYGAWPTPPVSADGREVAFEVASQLLPFHLEPRCELLAVLRELTVERIRRDPAPCRHLGFVRMRVVVRAADEDRAQLVFRALVPEMRDVLELVDERQRALERELLLESPRDRIIHPFAGAWMAAAAVRPERWPQALARVALLNQQLAAPVEHEERKRAVQKTRAVVARGLRQRAELVVVGI